MITRFSIAACLFNVVVAANVSTAGTMIASQDFESNSIGMGLETSADNANFATTTGIAFDGTGLGWTASISANSVGSGAPVTSSGDGDGDLIGVVNASSPGFGSNSLSGSGNGGKWFHIDDADGTVSLAFDSVSTTGFTNLELQFEWASSETGFESADFLSVSVNGVNQFLVSDNLLETGSSNFANVSLDLSLFDGQNLDIVFSANTNASTEDIGIDNIVLTGVAAVPEPTSLLIFGSVPVALFLRRRR